MAYIWAIDTCIHLAPHNGYEPQRLETEMNKIALTLSARAALTMAFLASSNRSEDLPDIPA